MRVLLLSLTEVELVVAIPIVQDVVWPEEGSAQRLKTDRSDVHVRAITFIPWHED